MGYPSFMSSNTAEAEKNKDNGGTRKGDTQQRRIRSLSDLLFRSEFNNEEFQEGPYEREDSDYEGEMELDFETSISGDEGRDVESSILRGSLNFRFHQSEDSNRENSSINGSQASPLSSSQHESSSSQVFGLHYSIFRKLHITVRGYIS